MKAYEATNEDGYVEVVFAESAGKAKQILLRTDPFLCYDYMDIRVRRCPKADRMYRGVERLNWYNNEERLFMVKELGQYCMEYDEDDCDRCIAKEYCSNWEDEE